MELTTEFTKADLEVMADAENYLSWLLNKRIRPVLGTHVLEVGSGIGNYSAGIIADPKVMQLTCVELDPTCLKECRRSLANANKPVKFLQGDFLQMSVEKERYDTVICINVLEHLQNDALAVSKMYEALLPGGSLILFVPAFPILAGKIDERLGHFRRYTKRSAKLLLRGAGFSVTTVRYYNLFGFFGWFVRFRLLQRNHQSSSIVGFFDRVIFPWQSAVEEKCPWLPFGQSLFAVATKPCPNV